MIYPSLLSPNSSITIEHLEVPLLRIALRKWTGEPLANNNLGAKPLIDFAGRPQFAEVVILKLCQLSGWESRWVQTYSMKAGTPRFLNDWADKPLTLQQSTPIEDAHAQKAIAEVRKENNTYSGCWDIFTWHNNQLVFAEVKRSKKDKLTKSQITWLQSAITVGLSVENFVVVEWDFI